MTYDFFREYYDLSEYEILNIKVLNQKFSIQVIMPIHLELIANGYRPELDMTQTKTFLFDVLNENKEYPKDITIEFKEDTICIGNDILQLNGFRVDICG